MTAFAKRYTAEDSGFEEGVWIDLGDEIQIKIVPTRSKQARTVLSTLNEHYEKACESSRKLLEAVQNKLIRQWIAKTILLDWRGVTDTEGKPLDYSEENALKVFESFPDFFDEVVLTANRQEPQRGEGLTESAACLNGAGEVKGNGVAKAT